MQVFTSPTEFSSTALAHAGQWFLHSGIQAESGGVARYYLSDSRRNAPVSTEITGYAVSTFVYLHQRTGENRAMDAARRAAHYLVLTAWDERSATFPFEPIRGGAPAYAYFFDCGIIARGLLSLWRATREAEWLESAKRCALSMAFDFMADEAMHPVLSLPDKQPLAYEPRWSRQPGCYQLKSALAWLDLSCETGERELAAPFHRMLDYSLATHSAFLPGDADHEKVMDRLHAYCYFLEALLSVAGEHRCRAALSDGIERVAAYLRDIDPLFARADVYAQLLRIRLFADRLKVAPLDLSAASEEAGRLETFQATSGLDSATAGGFWFGRKQGRMMPFVNPVSTAFGLQALAMWQEYRDGGLQTPLIALV